MPASGGLDRATFLAVMPMVPPRRVFPGLHSLWYIHRCHPLFFFKRPAPAAVLPLPYSSSC